MLNVTLRLRQFCDNSLTKADMSGHVIYNRVKVAQLESKSKGWSFSMDAHDSFKVGPEPCKNGQGLLKCGLDMISELIDDALELVVNFLIK